MITNEFQILIDESIGFEQFITSFGNVYFYIKGNMVFANITQYFDLDDEEVTLYNFNVTEIDSG
jgi:hypothetical protein